MALEYKKVEQVVKSFANQRRIQVLEYIAGNPTVSVDQLAQKFNTNFITISDHIRKLYHAGLIDKTRQGKFVRHTVTKLGKDTLSFCKMI
ncbi:MAG TPA: winged helix-turn-helix domain-containing protein [Candidatus Paceibacterota bacterium]|nr:winged helix-turn-helix domain-containing protein [Candidatus Paceibacterota bacterium]